MAGTLSTIFDWVGFVGVLFAGWASDKFFKGKRTQIIVGMTIGMALAFIFLGTIGTTSVVVFGIGLSLCGFMLMGPDSLLSGVGAGAHSREQRVRAHQHETAEREAYPKDHHGGGSDGAKEDEGERHSNGHAHDDLRSFTLEEFV